MHTQQIIIMGRILYDIELSYMKKRFYFVVRRRVSRHYHQDDDFVSVNAEQKKESKEALKTVKRVATSRKRANDN